MHSENRPEPLQVECTPAGGRLAADAGIVDEDVEAAEFPDSVGNKLLNVGLDGDVDPREANSGAECAGQFAAEDLAAPSDDHRGAFTREECGRLGTDPAGAPTNHCNLAVEEIHLLPHVDRMVVLLV